MVRTGAPSVVRRAVDLASRVGAATTDVDLHGVLRRELALLLEAFAAAGHTGHDVRGSTRAVEGALPEPANEGGARQER